MFDTDLLATPPGPDLARMLAAVDVEALDADDALTFVQAVRRQQAWTESLGLQAVARFAEVHDEVPAVDVPGAERMVRLGGEGTPECGSFTPDELGAELRVSRYSAERLIADALDLKHRLPGLLMAVRTGGTDAYRARIVSGLTRDCSLEAAATVEERVLRRVDRLTRSQVAKVVDQTLAVVAPEIGEDQAAGVRETRHVTLEPSRQDHIDVHSRMAAGWALRLDARVDQLADMFAVVHPELEETKDQLRARALGLLADPDAVLALMERYREIIRPAEPAGAGGDGKRRNPAPPTTLYVHLSPDGVVDLEGYGVLSMPSLVELLAGDNVTVKPVIDLAHMASSTGYQPSDSLTEGVVLANPRCVFPFCDRPARKCQLDHTIPWPHGPTAADNLGPLCQRHHNVKTHGRWQLKQPFRGIFVWRSPTGRVYTVDHRETAALEAA
jgi:hypothetical protein